MTFLEFYVIFFDSSPRKGKELIHPYAALRAAKGEKGIMLKSCLHSFVSLVLALALSQVACAEQNPCPPAFTRPSTAGPINTDTAVPIPKGRFVLNPVLYLSFSNGAFDRSWNAKSAGGRYRSIVTGLRFYYGAADHLEIYGIIPLVYNDARQVGPRDASADFGGLGDIQLLAKYQIVQESSGCRPAISAVIGFSFPTGHYRRLNYSKFGTDQLGTGSYRLTAGLNASKYLKPFIFYANIWYIFSTDCSVNTSGFCARVHPRDRLAVNLAAELPLNERWTACLDVNSFFDAGRLIGCRANTAPAAKITFTPELQYKVNERITIAGGVGFDVIGKEIRSNITPQLSFYFLF